MRLVLGLPGAPGGSGGSSCHSVMCSEPRRLVGDSKTEQRGKGETYSGDVISIAFFRVSGPASPNQRTWDGKHSPLFSVVLFLLDFTWRHRHAFSGINPKVFICLGSLVPPLGDRTAQGPRASHPGSIYVGSFSLQRISYAPI